MAKMVGGQANRKATLKAGGRRVNQQLKKLGPKR